MCFPLGCQSYAVLCGYSVLLLSHIGCTRFSPKMHMAWSGVRDRDPNAKSKSRPPVAQESRSKCVGSGSSQGHGSSNSGLEPSSRSGCVQAGNNNQGIPSTHPLTAQTRQDASSSSRGQHLPAKYHHGSQYTGSSQHRHCYHPQNLIPVSFVSGSNRAVTNV